MLSYQTNVHFEYTENKYVTKSSMKILNTYMLMIGELSQSYLNLDVKTIQHIFDIYVVSENIWVDLVMFFILNRETVY